MPDQKPMKLTVGERDSSSESQRQRGSDDRPALVRVIVPKGVDADVVADALWGHGPASVLDDGDSLAAGFASPDAAERVAAALPWPASVEVVEDDSWQDAWKAHAAPVQVGDLLVVPSWFEVVRIDAGTAFGSGSHASTQLCLAAVTELVTPTTTVLDVGCGSGILSIAAMRLGARSATAIDVTTEAVATTIDNAATNGVSVDARHVLVDDVDGSFDLVLANIGAAVLREMASALVPRVAGTLVLAGILDEQVPDVVAAYVRLGLHVDDVPSSDGWAAPRLRR